MLSFLRREFSLYVKLQPVSLTNTGPAKHNKEGDGEREEERVIERENERVIERGRRGQ